MEDERYYTVAQMSAQLQVSEHTIRNWLTRGKLRGVKLGANRAGWRIRERDIDEFLKEQGR
jgi:excisionase family DNA binding protein